jgi:hypothetical protein
MSYSFDLRGAQAVGWGCVATHHGVDGNPPCLAILIQLAIHGAHDDRRHARQFGRCQPVVEQLAARTPHSSLRVSDVHWLRERSG